MRSSEIERKGELGRGLLGPFGCNAGMYTRRVLHTYARNQWALGIWDKSTAPSITSFDLINNE